jgi:hypothetical protein
MIDIHEHHEVQQLMDARKIQKAPISMGSVSKEEYFKGKKSLSQCGTDTLEYLPSKASVFEWYAICDTTTSAQYNSSFSQYYETPQAVTVEGACFYAYNFIPGTNTDMSVKLYSVTVDSFPDALLAQAPVTVTDDYSATNLDVMKYCVSFPSPVQITGQGFHIAVENNTTDSVYMLANSFNNNDGAGEGLSFAFYSDSAFPSFVGWYDQFEAPYNWDFDWIINPFVSYDLETTISLTNSNECEGDSMCFDVTSSPLIYSDMYNSGLQLQYWTWGDGNNGINDSCYVYAASGNYEAIAYFNLQGWSSTCYTADTVDLTVLPLPVASFSTTNEGSLQVTVEDNGSIADSVMFDMSDGATFSGPGPHLHTYSVSDTVEIMMVAYNDCGTDTSFASFVPDTALGLLDLNNTVDLYPNPANQALTVALSGGQVAQLYLYNAHGKLVAYQNFKGQIILNTSAYSNGIYMLQIRTNDGIANKPVIIRH